MYEEGFVDEIRGNLALVRFERKAACRSCPIACEKGSGNMARLWAENAVGAKVGNRVRVYLSSELILISASLCYGVPTVFFVTGFLVPKLVFSFSDISSFLVALCSLGLSFLILRPISGYLGQKLVPRIEKLV